MALSHSSAVFVVTVFAQDGRVDVSDSIASMLRELVETNPVPSNTVSASGEALTSI